MKQYLNLKIGARARLASLRKSAQNGKWVKPMTWKDCRFANFKNVETMSQGFNGKTPIYYGFEETPFNRVKDACDILKSRHTGYFADTDQRDTYSGFVVCLPHSRYLCGYKSSDTGEYVIFSELFFDIESAAIGADFYAQKYANLQYDDNCRFEEWKEIETEIELMQTRRAECVAMARVNFKREAMREESAELRAQIKSKREFIEDNYAEFI